MQFDIVTIFPGFFAGIFEHGIVRRAQAEGLVTIGTHDLRNYTHDRHRTVDDRPFGGGEGMVLKPEPLAETLDGSRAFSPKPTRLPQNLPRACRPQRDSALRAGPAFYASRAREFATLDRVVLSAAAMRAWTSASISSTATWSSRSATTF